MQTRKLVIVLVFILIIFSSCNPTPLSEPDRLTVDWIAHTFTQCGDDYYAQFIDDRMGFAGIYVDDLANSSKSGIIEFKHLGYVIKELPLNDTDKLNGIEYHGVVEITNSQWRLNDGTQWRQWVDMPIVYSSKALQINNKMLDHPQSPNELKIEKKNGKWSGFSGYGVWDFWVNITCDKIPK